MFIGEKYRVREEKLRNTMKRCTNIELRQGPKGGFRSLSYSCIDEKGQSTSTSLCYRKEADYRMTIMRKLGLEIKVVKDDDKPYVFDTGLP
jgi:hypothetical protein